MRIRTTLVCILISLGSGCIVAPSPEASASESAGTLDSRLQSLNRDLGVGDTGDDVATVHEYLSKYGYFPNPQLARDYPAWRPLVDVEPASRRVFDEHTAEAIEAFQHNMALEPTGVVDAPTRAALRTERCGMPDGIHMVDPSDKFDYQGTPWTKSTLTWRLTTAATEDGITLAPVITQALNTWAAITKLSFTQITSGTPDITIQFNNSISGYGLTSGPPAAVVTMSTGVLWSESVPAPTNAKNLRSGLLHELGHALGFGHSSNPIPNCDFSETPSTESDCTLMFPGLGGGVLRRSPKADDIAVAGSLYDRWVTLPGSSAIDVAVNNANQVWVIGTVVAAGGGNRIYKWNGSNDPNGFTIDSAKDGAIRGIAIEGDSTTAVPWVVNNVGEIYRRTSSNPTTGDWTKMPGCAHDIGASGSHVWVIGCTQKPGGFSIHKWNGTSWDADSANGGGMRIAVRAKGIPWVVTDAGRVMARTSPDPKASAIWSEVQSDNGFTGAKDIAFGTTPVQDNHDNDVPYVVGSTAVGNDFQVYVYDLQAGVNIGSPPPRTIHDWFPVKGASGQRIAARGAGSLWLARGSMSNITTILRNTN